jgi:hypothetical protein
VGVVAYVVKIGGPQAALHPGQPSAERLRLTRQVARQRMHPCGSEHHRIAFRRC